MLMYVRTERYHVEKKVLYFDPTTYLNFVVRIVGFEYLAQLLINDETQPAKSTSAIDTN
jgi:hypothetical protein